MHVCYSYQSITSIPSSMYVLPLKYFLELILSLGNALPWQMLTFLPISLFREIFKNEKVKE